MLGVSRSLRGVSFPARVVSPRSLSTMNLTMFPENGTASKQFQEGNFQRALPDYQRILEIVRGLNTAQCNPMLMDVVKQLVKVHLYMGQTKKAVTLLNEIRQLPVLTSKEHVHTHILLSKSHIWGGDNEKGFQSAHSATETLEAMDSDAEISLFSDCYGQLGLGHLLRGEIDDAEGFFQMSARWAQTPLQQLQSTNNFGAVEYYKLRHASPAFDLWQYHMKTIQADPRGLLAGGQTNKAVSSVLSAEEKLKEAVVKDDAARKHLQRAVDLWRDTIQELQSSTPASTTSEAQNTAAAMCGPMGNTSGSSKSAPEVTMMGLTEGEIRTVPSSSHSNTGSENGGDNAPAWRLSEALQRDVDVTVAYISLLCNLSEALVLLGERSEAAELLSTALKAVSGPNPLATNLEVYGITGRVLRLVADNHARAGQLMTAEGLYRAALDKGTSPCALFDPRYQYETALTRGVYGQLLGNWEKREETGEAMRTSALQELEKLRNKSNESLLTPLLLYTI